jgi:hemerythrin-like domain-containing protein
MSDENSCDDVYQSMLDEHAHLRRMLDELQQLFSGHAAAKSAVVQRVASLQSVIDEHFRTEELSGCFGEMVSQAPRFAPKVEQLIMEHSELAAQVGQLATMAGEYDGSESQWQELGQAFQAFRERLLLHESVENELLQSVFTEDLGSKD